MRGVVGIILQKIFCKRTSSSVCFMMIILVFATIGNIYGHIFLKHIIWTRWAPIRRIALFLCIITAAFGFGNVLSFIIFPYLSAKSMLASIGVGYVSVLLIITASFIVSTIDYYERHRFKDSKVNLEYINWTSIKRIKPSLWLALLIFLLFFSALYSFYATISFILQDTGFFNSPQIASNYLFFHFIVSFFALPYFGWLLDFHRRYLAFLAIGVFSTSIPIFCFLGNAYGIFCFAVYLQPFVSM